MKDLNLEIIFRDFVKFGDYKTACELAEKAKGHGYVIESYERMMSEDQEKEDREQFIGEARSDFERGN